MADSTAYSLVADSDGNISLEPNNSNSTLEIKGNPETIVKNIIPDNGGQNPPDSGAYMSLFSAYIATGTTAPTNNIDKRCRIYIKYEA